MQFVTVYFNLVHELVEIRVVGVSTYTVWTILNPTLLFA